MNNILSRNLTIFLLILMLHSPALQAKQDEGLDRYLNLSLEELAEIPVFSVSKRSENSFKTASAIFTLTSNDIKRSGGTSIPEVLRLVPGVNVARIDSSKWAVSARGFNRQFSNKLLVMIDGRTVYNNLFSGVYWDTRGDVPLELIDRIEVIRGPGASVWGENAVNGVINIITKEAIYTKGSLASAYAGNEEGGIYYRYGGKIQNENKKVNTNYRAYIKRKEIDETETQEGSGSGDDWYMNRAGFRFDIDYSKLNDDKQNMITLSGDAYNGSMDQIFYLPSTSSPPTDIANGDEDATGGNITAKWEKSLDNDRSFALQFFVDLVKRRADNFASRRNTYEIDYQYSFKPFEKHNVVWGVGYRFIEDNLESYQAVNGLTHLSYDPTSQENDLISGFIQDTYSIRDNLALTVGSRFEHNDFTHFEYQPSARLSYSPTIDQTIWTAVSRAIRTPTRGEDAISLIAAEDSGAAVTQVGTTDFNSEESLSVELGYRNKALKNLTFDFSSFYTRYDRLRSQETGTVPNDLFTNSDGVTALPLTLRNDGSADVYGGELSVNYNPVHFWKLIAGYTFLKIEEDLDASYSDTTEGDAEGSSPRNQFNFRSQLDITDNIELDNTIYYVDNLGELGVENYIRFDTRIGYRPKDNIEISIVGQNLFDSTHQEFSESLYSVAAEIERSFYVNIEYKF